MPPDPPQLHPGTPQPSESSQQVSQGRGRGGQRRRRRRGRRSEKQSSKAHIRPASELDQAPQQRKSEATTRRVGPKRSRPISEQSPSRSLPVYSAEDISVMCDGLTQLGRRIASSLSDGSACCAICSHPMRYPFPLETMTSTVSLWFCPTCKNPLHLSCVEQWALGHSETFPCPLCNARQPNPPIRKCYCGAEIQPSNLPGELPYSHGGPCRVQRPCGHPCHLHCHPGPCPPCQRIWHGECYCGKTKLSFPCGELTRERRSCGSVCGKPLSCGRHYCQRLCHEGPCGDCDQMLTVRCFCGANSRTLQCAAGADDSPFCCGEPCSKPLPCGCKCPLVCHTGPCPPCRRAPGHETHCECGKTPVNASELSRTHHDDPLPTCEEICGKPLSHVPGHVCQLKCHSGPCEFDPDQLVRVPCHCGSKQYSVPIGKFLEDEDKHRRSCQTKCLTPLSCGKHVCRRKCCPGRGDPHAAVHKCPQICNKILSCGNCVCGRPCHPGDCDPCFKYSSEPLVCVCGETRIDPPVPCGTQLPQCPNLCPRPRDCGHEPDHLCHDASQDCPPCSVLVPRKCFCGAMEVLAPCGSDTTASCGQRCPRVLCCGEHQCPSSCHPPDRSACFDPSEITDPTPCSLVCGKLLPCGHTCPETCHVGTDCPPCQQVVVLTCDCGQKRVEGICGIEKPVCDESCHAHAQKIAQNRRLVSRMGIMISGTRLDGAICQLPAELITLCRAYPDTTRLLEQQWSMFVDSQKKRSIYIPDERGATRIAELYAPFWNFTLDGVNKVIRNDLSCRPAELASFHLDIPYLTRRDPVIQRQTLVLHELSTSISSDGVYRILVPHTTSFTLKWLSESACAVVFPDLATANTVGRALDQEGHGVMWYDDFLSEFFPSQPSRPPHHPPVDREGQESLQVGHVAE